MKVLKLAIVVAIAYGVWFQFIGNVYETGRWRLSEECGRIGSDRVRALWVSAQIALRDKERSLNINTFNLARVTYSRLYAPSKEAQELGKIIREMEEERGAPSSRAQMIERENKCLAWLLANSD